jgi:uncharacterized membrane protein
MPVTAEMPATSNEPLTPRLQQFQAEVEQLKVTGGRANPERTWMIIGGVAMAAGVILTLVAWLLTQGTSSNLDFASYNAMGTFGMTLTIAGSALFLVMSVRRYLRYWLVRFIYEMRDQTDRVVTK